MTSELRFNKTLQAEPGEVYRMFTNSTAMREWLADRVFANPVPGGCVYLEWRSGYYAAGWFGDLHSPDHLTINLQGRGEPGPSQVEVGITADDSGSRVTLIHSGLGEGSEWAKPRKEIQRGWDLAFERLAHSIEKGADLRITRKPMLGILFGVFSPQIASKLGVPVSEGLLLSGTIEGLSAQKAGMQKDDVIVAIKQRPTPNFNEVQTALHGKKAGDVIQVTYYRGAE
ncbi:MAG: SRPBCC domain-containing protein, partial [Anaerolineaceae bacterium]|nr:SRPBCC domain-containing protein [Anaerolineaceae bacterium]